MICRWRTPWLLLLLGWSLFRLAQPSYPLAYHSLAESKRGLHSDIAEAILARRDGVAADPLASLFPTVEDGVLGVKFVEAAVASHQQDGHWVNAAVDVR
jgi:hypothetical protein